MARRKNSLDCPKCSFEAKSEQSLRVHQGLAHKAGAGKKKKVKKKGKVGRPRGSRCPQCGKLAKTAAALKTHITRMHGGKARARAGRRVKKKAGRASSLDRRLMGLSLAEVADLHEACRKELGRRLAELAG